MQPTLILRFRNRVEGARDGIDEHRRILFKENCVWWGWWRRINEELRERELTALKVPFTAHCVSPSEKVGFAAQVAELRVDSSPPASLVPAYYNSKISEIPVWFKLTSISTLDGDVLDEWCQVLSAEVRTLFFLRELEALKNLANRITSLRVRSPYIVHLSDVHLGSDHAFVRPGEKTASGPRGTSLSPSRTLTQAVAADLNSAGIEPGFIVITGDIVTRNRWDPRRCAKDFITDLCADLNVPVEHAVALPGNHDFFRGDEEPKDFSGTNYQHEDSFRLFLSSVWRFEADAPLERVFRLQFDALDCSVLLGCLNSARWTTVPGFAEFGFVGRDRMEAVVRMLNAVPGPTLRFLALHHHLVTVGSSEWIPETGDPKPVSVTLDAGHVLDMALGAGVSAILHGHQHTPAVAKISRRRILRTGDAMAGELTPDVHILAGGTAGSKERDESVGNCYGVLHLSKSRARYDVRGLDPSNGGSRILGSVEFQLYPNS